MLSVQPIDRGTLSSAPLRFCVSFHSETHRSATGMKSTPRSVSSTCLHPFLRIIRGKPSSASREFSLCVTVGWVKNSIFAV